MAFPRFMYGDPSKCVDHIRRKRAQREEWQKSKQESAREELEKLFKKEKDGA